MEAISSKCTNQNITFTIFFAGSCTTPCLHRLSWCKSLEITQNLAHLSSDYNSNENIASYCNFFFFFPEFEVLNCRFTFMTKLFPHPAYAQLKGLFPSWSPCTWLSTLKWRVNSLLQPFLGHRSFLFSPEWTRSSCWCKNQALLNSFLHRPHGTLAGGIDFCS